jgi:hypothetical protein
LRQRRCTIGQPRSGYGARPQRSPYLSERGWCDILGIAPPKLETVLGHREANTYALLIVALLEHGAPMTLADVATRFAAAGVADRSRALLSLQRCKPARTPVVREGELYLLDPHDDELDLWAFRLGLRPPKCVASPRAPAPDPPPLPGPEVPLSTAELDEAWRDASLSAWSPLRLAVAVLDAHGGPLAPMEVVVAVDERSSWHMLRLDAAHH